ncbi:helix-turn-helix transcriptional regulator [Candidatus Palauibacter sp.]|uniref:helix-turn-helix transcriptional regulator n=1 Tax=Candidatus Palauibacter sp. TaxID=3101350 RepID=UPI003B010135
MPTRILRRPQVLRRIGLGKSTLYRMLDGGTFPRPVKLGLRAVGWREDEIEDWLGGRERVGREAAE